MTIEISPEDEALLHTLVNAGAFASVEDAIHTSIAGLASTTMPMEADDEWLSYADQRIEAGLADTEAGRTISAEQFLAELNARHSRNA